LKEKLFVFAAAISFTEIYYFCRRKVGLFNVSIRFLSEFKISIEIWWKKEQNNK